MELTNLSQTDPVVARLVSGELERQRNCIELIASENFISPSVMEAMGSVLSNKYAEGLPSKRYYGGCHVVDEVERLAIERICKLFDCNFANVQAHSGVNANIAAYLACIKPGDTVLGMNLAHGGHLSHGSPVNFSGILYNIVAYGLDPQTETINMDEVERVAKETRPKMIIVGASAYPRILDFERFGSIAKEVDAYLLADIAHISGLIAGGVHPSAFPYADVCTSTTHKTLRGPRGGFILANDEVLAAKLNKAIFPGTQGGPLMHVIAAKAVAFAEALKPEFREYSAQVVKNAKAMGEGLIEGGLRLVSGGTDNHLCLVDLTAAGITGNVAEELLESLGITANKNAIPFDKLPPAVTSGIRVGAPAMTTRGFDEKDSKLVGELIARAIFERDNPVARKEVADTVQQLIDAHPLYTELKA
ncbi:MAG: serine hydroxymethyltransferase [Coriobacteriia bacterium]|nr:serine hydroxymethyltransferase [Coriobacteriia bacterium]MCL2750062.1 serine hydroxymethyltransferase [Coriobacteriia bacterium]